MTPTKKHNIGDELDAMVEDGRLGALAKRLAREAGVTGDVDDAWYQRALDHVRKYWVSGETITDEQIRELEANTKLSDPTWLACRHALHPIPDIADYAALAVILEGAGREALAREARRKWREARARCAAAWNTKHGVGK